MQHIISLDRSVKLKLLYPIGVKEKITFTYNELITITDVYEVLISKSLNDRDVFITVAEGSGISKSGNVLTWDLEFNYADLTEGSYAFEIRNKTLDVIEYSGTLKTLKTINND